VSCQQSWIYLEVIFFRARYPEATPQRVKTVSHSGQVLEANHEKDGEGNFEM
jgi:hypothetical protein